MCDFVQLYDDVWFFVFMMKKVLPKQ